MPRLLRDMAVLGVACFFAVMWGSLLRERIAVSTAPTVMPKYDQLLAEDEDERVSTMGIYRGSQRIGDTTTRIERNKDTGSFDVTSKTRVELKGLASFMFRTGGDLELDFRAEISPLSGLRSFQVTCPRLDVALGGVVREKTGAVREKTLIVIGIFGGDRVRMDIPYTSDPFVGEVFTPTSGLPDLQRARIGDSWSLNLVNPMVGSVQNIRVSVKERVRVGSGRDAVTLVKLAFNSGSRAWHAWVTEKGEVLVQGTPLGLTLRREDLPPHIEEVVGR